MSKKYSIFQLLRNNSLMLVTLLLIAEGLFVPTFGQSTTIEDERCIYPGVCTNEGSLLDQLLKDQRDQKDMKTIIERLKADLVDQGQKISRLETKLSDVEHNCCRGPSTVAGIEDELRLPTIPPYAPQTSAIPTPRSCIQYCTQNYDPVCGTDGATYPNVCALESHACTKNVRVEVAHKGRC